MFTERFSISKQQCADLINSIKVEAEKLLRQYEKNSEFTESEQFLFDDGACDSFSEFANDVARLQNQTEPRNVLAHLTETLYLYAGKHNLTYRKLENMLVKLDVYCHGEKMTENRKSLLPNFQSLVENFSKYGNISDVYEKAS